MEPNENVSNSQQGSRQGKRRIVIERQPTDKKRNATFLNRRAGLLKKARELARLCGLDVTLIVFSSQGELYEFSSNTNAHILYQYLVKKQEQEGHTVDQELVALYYGMAHVEALEHEANRDKYNLKLHRVKTDLRLRKFTVNELQIINEHNLLNMFEQVLQNNQKAILEFYEKSQEINEFLICGNLSTQDLDDLEELLNMKEEQVGVIEEQDMQQIQSIEDIGDVGAPDMQTWCS